MDEWMDEWWIGKHFLWGDLFWCIPRLQLYHACIDSLFRLCQPAVCRPFCATFLNFIGYALGAVRVAALSNMGIIYIMTHDSIGLGKCAGGNNMLVHGW